MTTHKKYDFNGKELGDVVIDEAFLNVEANGQMVKDYLIALRANSRQWSASTKGRSEVVHTTKKPHRQKGTGGARQGSLVVAQCRGGGVVFGPKPKFDQHVRINRKERRKAIQVLLAEKIKSNQVIVMADDAFSKNFKKPQTKIVADFLKKRELFGRKILFLGEGNYETVQTELKAMSLSIPSEKHAFFKQSMRNIPEASYSIASNVNGYDVAAARTIVMTESALNELIKLFK